MRHALVTGAAGFVGRHLSHRLLADGWAVDRFDLTTPRLLPVGGDGERVWAEDVRQWALRDNTPPGYYDLAVHCAALVGGRQTIEGEPLSQAVDLAMDAAFFQWATRARPAHVVYYSSSAAYPVNLQTNGARWRLAEWHIDLDDVGTPDMVYGWAKLTGEVLARYARRDGVNVHVLRPFSGYGADQSLDYPFPSFVQRALRRDDPFVIWGDGTQVRDWVHIEDVVGATLAVVDADYPDPVNIGWGQPVTFNDLAELVCRVAGYTPTVKHLPDAPAGVHYRVSDPTRLFGLYRPTITLEQGVRRALGKD